MHTSIQDLGEVTSSYIQYRTTALLFLDGNVCFTCNCASVIAKYVFAGYTRPEIPVSARRIRLESVWFYIATTAPPTSDPIYLAKGGRYGFNAIYPLRRTL